MKELDKPIRILLIEDNPADARLLKEMLAEITDVSFNLERVERLSDGLERLKEGGVDIVLLDLTLPDSRGLDTFLALEKQAPSVPITVLSGLDDATLAIQAVREGAQDYLVKGRIDSSLLVRVIRYSIERKRIEEALRESLQFSSSLLGNSPHPVLVINPDSSIRYANPALEKLTGFSASELTGQKPPYPWWPEETWEKHKADLERAIQEGAERMEALYVNKNGEPFWVEVNIKPVSRDGEFKYLLSNWVDITARKEAEEEIRRRAAHLEALNSVIAAAAAATDLSELLDTALGHTLQALGLEKGSIWRAGQYVTRGLDSESGEVRPHEALAAGLAIAKAIAVEDWQRIGSHSPLSMLVPVMERFGIRASLAVPILVEDRRIGGLAAVSHKPRRWRAEEIALVEAIGQQLGAATERLRLFQAEREQRELAEALQKAAAAVGSTLDTDVLLDRILEQVEHVVPGDAFNIMLLTGDGQVQVARRRGYEQLGDHTDRKVYALGQIPNLPLMVNTGEPIVIADTAADATWISLEGREWLRSYVGAPIRVGDLTVGFLNVNGTRPGQFGPADAQRLQALASHAATAIQNAQLYRQVRSYAEQLEQRVQERTAQLQAQYAQIEAILQSVSDGIIVTNARGEILQANPVAQAWLTQTLSPEDAARLQEAIRDLARQAEKRPETVLELAGLDLELSAAPIERPGQAIEVVIAAHDISHLKTLERMKSRFVSNVSHELRTPITTIKLYAALMQRTPQEKWPEYLDILIKEADRQARLVEDILQLSRIDSGRMEIRPRPTSVNNLTEITLSSHRMLAEQQGLHVEYHPGEPDLKALTDPDRITQVLTNLLANAIQYTPAGGTIRVATGKQETEGRKWAVITVTDTGMGINEEELPHIFERFFRGEQPRQMQVPGTGLGLAIAKELVELQGGRITVKSKVNEGSSFTIWLPLAE